MFLPYRDSNSGFTVGNLTEGKFVHNFIFTDGHFNLVHFGQFFSFNQITRQWLVCQLGNNLQVSYHSTSQSVEYLQSYTNSPQFYENVRQVFRTFYAEFSAHSTPRQVFHCLHAMPSFSLLACHIDQNQRKSVRR